MGADYTLIVFDAQQLRALAEFIVLAGMLGGWLASGCNWRSTLALIMVVWLRCAM
jgi:hypothetical protein